VQNKQKFKQDFTLLHRVPGCPHFFLGLHPYSAASWVAKVGGGKIMFQQTATDFKKINSVPKYPPKLGRLAATEVCIFGGKFSNWKKMF